MGKKGGEKSNAKKNSPKIVFTMLPVDVRLLIDPPHPSTRYSSSIMIHVCSMFYFYLVQASFQCFQADEEDEWPLSSVQAPWGVDIQTKMVDIEDFEDVVIRSFDRKASDYNQ